MPCCTQKASRWRTLSACAPLSSAEGLGCVKAEAFGGLHQNLGIRDVLAIGEIGLQKRLFHLVALALGFGPFDQLVGLEGVVDPHVVAKTEVEPQRCAKFGQLAADLRRLFGRTAVFCRQMLA